MRKVIAEIAVSVDGFIEGPDGELDWLIFEEAPSYVSDFLSRFEVIFYGRRAYERFGIGLGAGPETSKLRKYVFSRNSRHVAGNGMVVNENIGETVRRIREEDGKDIWLCGGAEIISMFAKLHLIDEYLLAVQPVILGTGKPLFSDLQQRIALQLLDAERLESGVVILNYRPAST